MFVCPSSVCNVPRRRHLVNQALDGGPGHRAGRRPQRGDGSGDAYGARSRPSPRPAGRLPLVNGRARPGRVRLVTIPRPPRPQPDQPRCPAVAAAGGQPGQVLDRTARRRRRRSAWVGAGDLPGLSRQVGFVDPRIALRVLGIKASCAHALFQTFRTLDQKVIRRKTAPLNAPPFMAGTRASGSTGSQRSPCF